MIADRRKASCNGVIEMKAGNGDCCDPVIGRLGHEVPALPGYIRW